MDIVHKLNSFVSDIKTEGVASPICYFADVEKGVMIMENLKKSGYVIQDKAKGNLISTFECVTFYNYKTYLFLQDLTWPT